MKASTRKRKKILFWSILILLVACGIELLSFVTLSLINEQWTTYGELRRRSAVAARAEEQPVETPELLDRVEKPPFQHGGQVIHPYVGFVMNPTTHWAARVAGHDPTAGDFGFPDNTNTLFQARSDTQVVIGIFGGSVAILFARHGGAQELARQLRTVPRFAGRKAVVLSLGGPGYKQPQQLMLLNYLLTLGAHFDIVLNIDGFNEVALPPVDHVRNGVFPFYPRGWYLRVADLDPETRKAIGGITYLQGERARHAALFSRRPLCYSMTCGLIWTLLDRDLRRKVSRYELALTDWKEPVEDYQTRGPRREYATQSELFRDIATVWRRSSLLMHLLCVGRGAEYYHVLQPNQYVPDSKPLSPKELRNAWRENHPYRRGVVAGYPFLIEAGGELRQQGVRFYDMTRVFADVRGPLYVDPCCHFNARGITILATEIARIIRSEPPGSRGSGGS